MLVAESAAISARTMLVDMDADSPEGGGYSLETGGGLMDLAQASLA